MLNSNSVDEMEAKKPLLFVPPSPTNTILWFGVFTSTIGGFLFGYEVGIINQIFSMESFNLHFGLYLIDDHGQYMKTEQWADVQGWITFTFLIGASGII